MSATRKIFAQIAILIFLWTQAGLCFALYRAGPGPGFYDFLNKTDQILVGKPVKVDTAEIDGLLVNFQFNIRLDNVVTKLVLLKFEQAYLISADGRSAIEHPIYLYATEGTVVYENGNSVYFLSNQGGYPNIEYSFLIYEDQSVGFWSQWDGSGLISYIKPLGQIKFIHPSQEGKRLSYTEFESTISDYLSRKSKVMISDIKVLLSPEVGLDSIKLIKMPIH